MDFHKITNDLYEATKHGHLPLLAAIILAVKARGEAEEAQNISGPEEVTGDNILPDAILLGLRRGALAKW